MSLATTDLPIGAKILRSATKRSQWNWHGDFWHRGFILMLTFFSYMSYHLTRKPISVVKNVLHPNCTNEHVILDHLKSGTNCSGWAPFGK